MKRAEVLGWQMQYKGVFAIAQGPMIHFRGDEIVSVTQPSLEHYQKAYDELKARVDKSSGN